MQHYVGQRFGRITVLSKSYRVNNQTCVDGRCDCGTLKRFHICNLKDGRSTQCPACGARQAQEKRDANGYTNATHGLTRTPFYAWWQVHKSKLCRRWQERIENVVEDIGDIHDGQHIVAIDVHKPIGPGNWEWVPSAVTRNTRTRHEELAGKTLAYWGERLGITKERVRQLVNRYGCIEAVLADRGIEP